MALAAHTPHHRTAEMQEKNGLMSKSKMCPKDNLQVPWLAKESIENNF
jgi:hypothetical protein